MAGLLALDHALFRFLNLRLANPVFDLLMPVVTGLGSEGGVGVLLAVVLVLLVRRRRATALRFALTAAAGVLAAGGVNRLIKVEVHRPRPQMVIPETRKVHQDLTQDSFPSGHTAAAFAGATVVAETLPGAGPWAFGFALLVGFSRIYVGAHFPSDVVAGAPIGALFGWLAVVLVWRRGARKNAPSPSPPPQGPGVA